MPKIRYPGPLHHSFRSFLTLNRIGARVAFGHLMGRKMAPDWDISTETGIRFWRHQFTRAMACKPMSKGRAIFDSLQTETDDAYDVSIQASTEPKGQWITPDRQSGDAVLLYLHGGGYTFNGPLSDRFGAMFSHHTGARLFMPHYRKTPEHPHPAQADDALAAWRYVTANVPADRVVVIGDSAGGHMALTLLQTLRANGLPQPALCVPLCPWTDIGARGGSLTSNDHYDLVQGWMALRFGEWLDPTGRYGCEALSPIYQPFEGLAPIYVQAGGREVLRDMIIEFAQAQAERGTDLRLDIWDDMPHNFQAYDSLKASSTEALKRIKEEIAAHTGGRVPSPKVSKIPHLAVGSFASPMPPD